MNTALQAFAVWAACTGLAVVFIAGATRRERRQRDSLEAWDAFIRDLSPRHFNEAVEPHSFTAFLLGLGGSDTKPYEGRDR